ncbi:saccharopine dehydrogenase related protein [Limosilactobacillus fastidiosus]|uniref:Saccharopine dehydrogenase related protein n=1 Tax=Limosilactobacillus fastidiosus TaxID=2759855 RepID=A0A7W3TYX1_9LACO|nr:saccharopine dehydrogenase related protein [Limosilactobacillus fastidiosus]MBB1062694.1 saccharopine dehydrogenase related protein [Limosilactobacillus fastidiosus]MBB1085792.1 saccharopine dehydrogenase related protein [Limosilactobacillus fastidiosus]MCD7083936.1 saccharopine dehydrogenase related protein [Limosilactobacillus fastidiosus]MCD7085871.1 saccharopine dehydrogenase related protein [Limosilactobacillus fastidiosus]MCD7113948.1 saccharopine dehydrogenase related protein [Limosi
MGRVVLIDNRDDNLASKVIKKIPDAIVLTNFKVQLRSGDILCWLPKPNDYVDDEAQELAGLIDKSTFLPAKIVMLSIPGTADDASLEQVERWYGKSARALIMMHQYAVKMIDEFEIPYTIVRVPPLISTSTEIRITAEGEAMSGDKVGINQVVLLLQTVLKTNRYLNQSIGIINSKGGQ